MESVFNVSGDVECEVYRVKSHNGDVFPAVDGIKMAKEAYVDESDSERVECSDLRAEKIGSVSEQGELSQSLVVVIDERSVEGEFV